MHLYMYMKLSYTISLSELHVGWNTISNVLPPFPQSQESFHHGRLGVDRTLQIGIIRHDLNIARITVHLMNKSKQGVSASTQSLSHADEIYGTCILNRVLYFQLGSLILPNILALSSYRYSDTRHRYIKVGIHAFISTLFKIFMKRKTQN